MHGEISLESSLGVGTKAMFWIPFNKAPYDSGDSPLIDMGPIPLRLQSELSVSDFGGSQTPGSPGIHGYTRSSDSRQGSLPLIDNSYELSDEDRRRTHVLIVEGKYLHGLVDKRIAYTSTRQPNQSTDRYQDHQETTILGECGMEWSGSLRLHHAAREPEPSKA